MVYDSHHHRPIGWGQDQIRAIGDAMREHKSDDWYVLARVAADALFPNRTALIRFAESHKLPVHEETA
jgi:hypothetical protein